MVQRDNDEIYMTIKALSEKQDNLFIYEMIVFDDLKSFEEAKLKANL